MAQRTRFAAPLAVFAVAALTFSSAGDLPSPVPSSTFPVYPFTRPLAVQAPPIAGMDVYILQNLLVSNGREGWDGLLGGRGEERRRGWDVVKGWVLNARFLPSAPISTQLSPPPPVPPLSRRPY